MDVEGKVIQFMLESRGTTIIILKTFAGELEKINKC